MAAGAIFVAPFIALLYRPVAGLVVMAFALGATSFLLHGAVDLAPTRARRWLHLVLWFNVGLIVACTALAAWLLIRS